MAKRKATTGLWCVKARVHRGRRKGSRILISCYCSKAVARKHAKRYRKRERGYLTTGAGSKNTPSGTVRHEGLMSVGLVSYKSARKRGIPGPIFAVPKCKVS